MRDGMSLERGEGFLYLSIGCVGYKIAALGLVLCRRPGTIFYFFVLRGIRFVILQLVPTLTLSWKLSNLIKSKTRVALQYVCEPISTVRESTTLNLVLRAIIF